MTSVPARLGAFAVALLAVFGVAFGVGRATGDPAEAGEPAADHDDGGMDHGGGFGGGMDHEMGEDG